jgi:hypothetical protein
MGVEKYQFQIYNYLQIWHPVRALELHVTIQHRQEVHTVMILCVAQVIAGKREKFFSMTHSLNTDEKREDNEKLEHRE